MNDTPSATTLRFHFAARSDVGAVREQNEDSAFAAPHSIAVADGLGGHAGGEIASSIAVGAIATVDPIGSVTTVTSMLDTSVRLADDVIAATEASDAELAGMGTTLTAVVISANTLVVCHIGDSRGYLLRDDALLPLTVDHTYIQTLLDQGKITAEQALNHPQRSVVLRALGGGTAAADISVRELALGDRLLLCSDGLSGVVPDDLLARVLRAYEDPTAAVQALVDLALLAGAPDNVTVVVADVVDSPAPRTDISVVVGAAAESRNQSAIGSESIRSRLADISGRAAAGTPVVPQPSTPLWPRLRRPLMALAALAAAVSLASAWVNAQWWVGVDQGRVVVGQGLAEPVLGINLGRITDRTSIVVRRLPTYDQGLLAKLIAADSREHALRIIGDVACRTSPVSAECVPGGR